MYACIRVFIYCRLGGRGSDDIVCWDVRSLRQELGRVERPLATNQRMYFDLDSSRGGQHLVTGSHSGDILIYNTSTFELVQRFNGLGGGGQRDCVNSVEFHPYYHYFASVNGQRHFVVASDSDSDSESDSEKDEVASSSSSSSSSSSTAAAATTTTTTFALETAETGGKPDDADFLIGSIDELLSRKKAKLYNDDESIRTGTHTFDRILKEAPLSELKLWRF